MCLAMCYMLENTESSEIMLRGRLNFHFLEPLPAQQTIMCTDPSLGDFSPWGKVTTSVYFPRIHPPPTLPVSPPNQENGADARGVEERGLSLASLPGSRHLNIPALRRNNSLLPLTVKLLWLKFEFPLHVKYRVGCATSEWTLRPPREFRSPRV